mgnify:FL=1
MLLKLQVLVLSINGLITPLFYLPDTEITDERERDVVQRVAVEEDMIM